MSLKIVFGIVIPLAVVVILALLGSLNIGFSTKTSYISEVSISELFNDGKLETNVKIGEVTLNNDYLFAKRFDLPNLKTCLIDSEGKGVIQDIGETFYGEGDYSGERYDLDYYGSRSRNVQIGAYGSKEIAIYVRPNYFSYENYNDLIQRYGAYDEAVIVEIDDSNYYNYFSCSGLSKESLDGGKKINILP